MTTHGSTPHTPKDDLNLQWAGCELFGRKWALQIVVVLLSGPHRFSAVQAALPGIGTKVLSRRLVELGKAGVVSRTQHPEIPPRVVYALTPAGSALRDVVIEMDRWSRAHLSSTPGEFGAMRSNPESPSR